MSKEWYLICEITQVDSFRKPYRSEVSSSMTVSLSSSKVAHSASPTTHLGMDNSPTCLSMFSSIKAAHQLPRLWLERFVIERMPSLSEKKALEKERCRMHSNFQMAQVFM